jgi:thiol-disulfide isomerase/thioredoxin
MTFPARFGVPRIDDFVSRAPGMVHLLMTFHGRPPGVRRGGGLVLGIGILRALGVTLVALSLAAPAPAKTPPAASRKAPHFELPAAHGAVDSDSLRGHVVYVDFWASWCEPCRRSFPWMASLHQRLAPAGLTIIAINLDKDPKAADRFLAEHPAPFTVAFDPAGHVAEAFQVKAMPSGFLLGRSGEILHSQAGFDPAKAATLDTLIQEACTR